jgi:hypothetical protein
MRNRRKILVSFWKGLERGCLTILRCPHLPLFHRASEELRTQGAIDYLNKYSNFKVILAVIAHLTFIEVYLLPSSKS